MTDQERALLDEALGRADAAMDVARGLIEVLANMDTLNPGQLWSVLTGLTQASKVHLMTAAADAAGQPQRANAKLAALEALQNGLGDLVTHRLRPGGWDS